MPVARREYVGAALIAWGLLLVLKALGMATGGLVAGGVLLMLAGFDAVRR